jgi:hypothetical protein
VVRPSLASVVKLYDDEARGMRPRRRVAEVPVINVIAEKMRIDARLRERGAHQPFVGAGARGHGKRRRYRDMAMLRQQESNLVKTFCEQEAAYIACQAASLGKVVAVDESAVLHRWHPDPRMAKWLSRFPFGMLRDKIVYACDKAGVGHALIKADRKCPMCGGDELDIGKKPRMRLDGHVVDRLTAVCHCGFDGPLEPTLAWRALQVASRTPEEKDRVDKSWSSYIEKLNRIEKGEHDGRDTDSGRATDSATAE